MSALTLVVDVTKGIQPVETFGCHSRGSVLEHMEDKNQKFNWLTQGYLDNGHLKCLFV